jgi:hypothetical protein
MSLQYFLNEQSRLQRVMQEKSNQDHPTDLYEELGNTTDGPEEQEAAAAITRFMQWNDKALIHEIVEMEAETGWKPWAKGAFLNLEAARGEWIDMFHFMLNGALLLGLDESEIRRRYDAKHAKNEARQHASYDGVSTKCFGCGRALDDDAVIADGCYVKGWSDGGDDARRIKPGFEAHAAKLEKYCAVEKRYAA